MTKPSAVKNGAKAAPVEKPATLKPAQTKKDSVLTLLRRDGGASLDEVGTMTGWQPHSTRAVFTGLRKKGFALERTRTDGVTRYAIAAEPSA